MRVIRQVDQTDCGPACLATVLDHWGRREPLYRLREGAGTTQSGTSMLGLMRAARGLGLEVRAFEADLDGLQTLELPVVLHWEHNHYVVLARLKGQRAQIADPGAGLRWVGREELRQKWTGRLLWLRPGAGSERGNFVGGRGLRGLLAHLVHFRGSSGVLTELTFATPRARASTASAAGSARGEPVGVNGVITVLSGSRLLCESLGWALQDLRPSRPVALVLDYPVGSALALLPALEGAYLIKTISASAHYLHDLAAHRPPGLIAEPTGLHDLRAGLIRVSRGQRVQLLPPLASPHLMPKEWTVLRLVVQGLDNEAIAARLGCSAKRIANYVNNLKAELGAQSRVDIVVKYYGVPGTAHEKTLGNYSHTDAGTFPYRAGPPGPTLEVAGEEVSDMRLRELNQEEMERVVGGSSEDEAVLRKCIQGAPAAPQAPALLGENPPWIPGPRQPTKEGWSF